MHPEDPSWSVSPMMACHQVNPSGIRALPVRYVAMLQLIRSPTSAQHTLASSIGWMKSHRSCGMSGTSKSVSLLRPGAHRRSVCLMRNSVSRGNRKRTLLLSRASHNPSRSMRQLDSLEQSRQRHVVWGFNATRLDSSWHRSTL